MKGILEFNLPDEESEFKVASVAVEWALVVLAIARELRKFTKYGHKFATVEEALEHIKGFLYEELGDRYLSLDEID